MKKKRGQCSPVSCSTIRSISNYMNANLYKVVTKIMADDDKFIPRYQADGAACVDLVANLDQDLVLQPMQTEMIDCGFSMELPEHYKAVISARSGLAKKGLFVNNAPGIIDSDYRGRVRVLVAYFGQDSMLIKKYDRIAQMSIEPVYYFSWNLASSLSETERNEGGFGSTS